VVRVTVTALGFISGADLIVDLPIRNGIIINNNIILLIITYNFSKYKYEPRPEKAQGRNPGRTIKN
jgi:hypothetical protein